MKRGAGFSLREALASLGSIFHAILRELADENAYQRHLAAHGCPHSNAEWRRFADERFARKYRRGKCC